MEAERHDDGVQNMECYSSRRRIIVGNTHLFFHPLADHIRLLQAAILEKELERFQVEEQQKISQHKSVGIILCGDLNR